MSKFPWKTTLAATAAVLAGTVYVFAASDGPMSMHGQMGQMMPQQGGMMDHMRQMQSQTGGGPQGMGGIHGGMQGHNMGGMGGHGGMHGQQAGLQGTPTLPGQDAFGAIQEVVQQLEADPTTDWSKVNIAALREHLIDMNEVTLRTDAATRLLDNGIEIVVTGHGRTLAAIKRMVPAHVNELREIGWNAKTEELPDGVKIVVTASEAHLLVRLKALGFMGLMVQGGHHQPHHLAMAKGEFSMH